jgi:hypothetical protein
MRDRLRAVECPAEIIDQIGGWSTSGVGSSYGNGYSIEVLGRWINKLFITKEPQANRKLVDQ